MAKRRSDEWLLMVPQNCHLDRSVPGFPVTRHSPTPACEAFSKESGMKFANATNLHRKSGVAQWRDLLFPVLTQTLRALPFRKMSFQQLLGFGCACRRPRLTWL